MDWLKQNTHGAVFDTITKATFDGLLVIEPHKDLIAKYELTVSPMMRRIESLLRESNVLSDLRDTLLPSLISGKLHLDHAEDAVA